MSIIVVENKDKVITTLCDLIENVSKECIQKTGIFTIGFSGGSLVNFLAKGLPNISSEFSKWRIYFCDERVVPTDDPESTYGLYKRTIIDTGLVPLAEGQFVTIKQGVSAEEAALDYEAKMKQHFPNDSFPEIDMLLLGMGPDGHTCSLFPGHKLLGESKKWISAITDSPKPPPCRITMTYPVINNATHCVFATAGKEKAEIVQRILEKKEDFPAGRVQPLSGKLYWILDEDAGLKIKTNL